ncbi:isochorismate synthase [Luteirhabdus pelagi]|uniref:isochorismate synthase n=1 Tax=Luteirhabdus pelagi TaxID=2792783 RepID=UPI001939C3EB|nr:isochorismate synthase [Luteirhabdus pelagi]
MKMSSFISALEKQHYAKIPFVVYSYPNADECHAWLQQKDYKLSKEQRNGFLFAPFDKEGKRYFQSFNNATQHRIQFPRHSFSEEYSLTPSNTSEKENYRALVEKAKRTIQQSETLQKIVVSRKKGIAISQFDLKEIMPLLFGGYPSAFRYLWYHPDTGFWAGATPETLVNIENDQYKTMALAGTKPNRNGKIQWTEKEREEQAIVTRTIISELKSIGLSPRVSDVYNQQAGSVVHLRTDITGEIGAVVSYQDIADVLHPTPAVCGEPRKEALRFLGEEESYNREFYTGYLGIIDSKLKQTQLFVNLRCMKLEETQISIYVGGGITADSDANDEWEETENKLQTMARVIAPLL